MHHMLWCLLYARMKRSGMERTMLHRWAASGLQCPFCACAQAASDAVTAPLAAPAPGQPAAAMRQTSKQPPSPQRRRVQGCSPHEVVGPMPIFHVDSLLPLPRNEAKAAASEAGQPLLQPCHQDKTLPGKDLLGWKKC